MWLKMKEDDTLISITARRTKGDIVYSVESSNSLTNEEFEYYLSEIIKGICKWKKDICEENIRGYKGNIKEKKK